MGSKKLWSPSLVRGILWEVKNFGHLYLLGVYLKVRNFGHLHLLGVLLDVKLWSPSLVGGIVGCKTLVTFSCGYCWM